MLKIIIKAVLMVAIFMAVGSYLIYLKTGRFWIPSFSQATKNISMPSFIERDTSDSMQPINVPTQATYKWLQNGSWHYGDKPPKDVKAIPLHKD